MPRCFVLDDEQYAADIIVSFIKKIPKLHLVGSSKNVFEAIDNIENGKVDILFLDVQMPVLTGIQILKIIGNKCKTILTTAYPDYALEGYDLNVVDYLMKPIAFDRFKRAVEKAEKQLETEHKKIIYTTDEKHYLLLKGDRKYKFHKVYLEDIYYIQGMKNYVKFVTQNTTIVSYQSLTNLQNQLPGNLFVRTHRSYIISIQHIRMIDGNTVNIRDEFIPIGERYQKAFFEFINGITMS
jgi:DNA-binding LytR/AlgR family response regulator